METILFGVMFSEPPEMIDPETFIEPFTSRVYAGALQLIPTNPEGTTESASIIVEGGFSLLSHIPPFDAISTLNPPAVNTRTLSGPEF